MNCERIVVKTREKNKTLEEKKIMHNTIAGWPLTDGMIISSWPTLPVYTLSMPYYDMEYPFGEFGSVAPAMLSASVLPAFCPSPHWHHVGWCYLYDMRFSQWIVDTAKRTSVDLKCQYEMRFRLNGWMMFNFWTTFIFAMQYMSFTSHVHQPKKWILMLKLN